MIIVIVTPTMQCTWAATAISCSCTKSKHVRGLAVSLRCRTTANLSNHTPLHIYRSPPKPLHSTFRTPLPAETTPLYIYHSTLLRNHSTLHLSLHSPPKSLHSPPKPLRVRVRVRVRVNPNPNPRGEWSDFGGEWSAKRRVEWFRTGVE
jgi:hypothetical protein